jgi:lincosamide and streptogramin A transport system ATP-binding/permease protein
MSLINISNLTFCYNNSELPVFENVNININTDWKTGLVGRNGKGKTTLLKILAGELNYSGSIAAQVKFTYFPFEVNGDDTAADIVKGLINDLELWRLQRELNLLDVEESALYIPYKNLSAGEKTKILLAALFLKKTIFCLLTTGKPP